MEPTSESRIACPPVEAGDRAHARRLLLARRKALTDDERAERAHAIATRLLEWVLRAVPRPPCVGFYWPMQGEPDLREAMRACHDAGVVCALPVVVVPNRPLQFRRWTPDTVLVAGPHGTQHPESEVLAPDLVVAPCVGFDIHGFRLGYGGGYYDRTLADEDRPAGSAGRAIGVAFDCCEVQGLQPHAAERPLEAVLTESRAIRPAASA